MPPEWRRGGRLALLQKADNNAFERRAFSSVKHSTQHQNYGTTMTATPALYLDFHGRFIDALGIQMYQKPTAAIAELIANAWDADAQAVEVTLPPTLTPGPRS
jgi:hypothetical protein